MSAVIQNEYIQNDTTTVTRSFTFPYLKTSDIKVSLDGVATTAFTLPNATTIQFNSVPAQNTKIKIFRETSVDDLTATFYAGSAIKSEDLNDNFTQNLYKTQEVGERSLNTLGDTMTGDLTMGEATKIVFEGATDDAHETTLTVANPTADRTITFPNVTGTVVTTGDTGTVATGMIAGDAVNGTKIADNSIDSEHYVDGSIDTAHIANLQVTTAKLAADAVTTDKIGVGQVTAARLASDSVSTPKIVDANVTTAKIAADAVTNAKIADNSIDSEHYVDGSIDNAHLANNSVTQAKMADDSVGTAELIDSSVDTARLADNSVTLAKMTNSSVGTAELVDDAVTAAKLASNAVVTASIVNANVTTAKIADDAVTNAKLAEDAVGSTELGDGVIDTVHVGTAQITDAKLASNAVTTAKISDANVTTAKIANDAITIGKIGCEQTTISDSDSHIPTSGAVVDYVAAQLAPLGGFEAIANEQSFPNTQPASGVVISIADAGGLAVSNTGTASGQTVGGTTVNITGIATNFRGSTVAAGIRFLVASTGSGQNYTYHKATLKEDDLVSLSGDINDFAERYRVGSSNPTSSLDNGDLFFNTSTGKMLVYNGTNTAWEEVQSIGNFFISTLSPAFDGTTQNFTITNAPTNVQQVLLVINGVVQKPNSGTSTPSEGFALDGSTVKLGAAPAAGSTYHAVVLGSTVNIGTPSNNTVSTAILQDDSVTAAKIAAGAVGSTELAANGVITSKIADNAVTTAKIANDAVTNAKIGSGAISTDLIADDAVTTTKIADDAVTADKLANDAVISSNIVNGNVTTPKIADAAVTLAKLEHGTSSNNGKFLRANNGADPTFETVTLTTINNNANNRIITGSDTADTLNGESALTFNNSTDTLQVHQTDTGNNPAFKSIHRGSSGSNINAHFTNYSGTNHTVILHDGSIGVGTQSPDTLLHLESTDPTLRFKRSDGSAYGEVTTDTAGLMTFKSDPGQNAGSNGFTFTIDNTPKITIDDAGNLDINGAPWSVTGGNYRNFSISGSDGSSAGFLWIGNGAATTNADFDLGRINFLNNTTITSQITASTETSANDDGRLSFFTKKTGESIAERMRLDDDGQLLIGETNAGGACKLGMSFGNATGNYMELGGTQRSANGLSKVFVFRHGYWGGGREVASLGVTTTSSTGGSGRGYGAISFMTGSSGNGDSGTDSVECMRLEGYGGHCLKVGDDINSNAAGRLQVINEQTNDQYNDCNAYFETAAADWNIKTYYNRTGTHYHMVFVEQGTDRGYISGSDGSNVTYQSGSDYRWKENVVRMTGTEGIDICKKLKPSKYNWIENRETTGEIHTVDGFIAHEVEEAGVLGAVTGEKDAVNEDGSIKGQMLDYGQLTPVLAAGIKGLIDKVEVLETKVAALEAA